MGVYGRTGGTHLHIQKSGSDHPLSDLARELQMLEADRFGDERFSVNNAEHDKCSIVRIATDQGPGALLQVCACNSCPSSD